MGIDSLPEELVVRLVVEAGLADDDEQARALVDLDVVRVDELSSAGYLVNVNGRQAVVSQGVPNLN